MSHSSQTRAISAADRVAKVKPVHAAAAFGGLVGLAIGAAYLGGVAAQETTLRAQAERIQGATAAGFTEEALSAAAGGLDPSALAIARRHDPYTSAGSAERDRQAELLAARLEQLRANPGDPNLRRASLSAPTPAQPFRMDHALDASRDLDCLTQAVYYEARGEGRDGMSAVAQVVLNRVRHPAFPKSVCGVVYQGAARRTGCQFSFTCSGVMRGRVNQAAWNRARDVASKALSGGVYAAVGNATHFHTTGVSPAWRGSLVRVSQVGSHLFYRFGGRSGSRGAFTYAPRPSTDADQPRLIQAAINPVEAARQAGEAVAYSLVLAQEGRAAPEAAAATTTAARPAAQQRSAPASASQAQPSTPSPAASARAQAAPTPRAARPAESPKPEAAASANAV
ncbi:MAG: cell wall hydrolase [Brevundimonas sp.]|uniref:Cell wall hydrolase n=1 Tax=Brevundimonas albigilva TaxID=1312364 RepID=A0ABY4SH91_9CAUL|nr:MULTISPECIES: cell wall hydrolase [Brevundimonas]PZU61556.1 MAG: cell wall hydrolase [Brevundimonas sp.]URI14123.1 cell wall hydrolase [Brevundimonas albigilva]